MIILRKKNEQKNIYKKIDDNELLVEKSLTGFILSLSQWNSIKKKVEKEIKIALELSSNECLSFNDHEMSNLSMIQINFETFKDGRPFSFAKNLRKKYGYEGELRAAGNILPDQYIFLLRCGFDTVEIPKRDKEVWVKLLEMDSGLYYQP
tara:strand:+ start:158 stop:607 length:450 start_codon:yes stop_codon:yes gene_type:complete